jgi:hypothetical protein
MAGKKKNNKVKETSAENAEIKVTFIDKDYSIKGGHRGGMVSVYKDIFDHVQEIPDSVARDLTCTTMFETYIIRGLWEGQDTWEHIENKLNIAFDEIDRKVILDANIRGVAVEVVTFNIDLLYHFDKTSQFYSDVESLPKDARAKVEKIIDKHRK